MNSQSMWRTLSLWAPVFAACTLVPAFGIAQDAPTDHVRQGAVTPAAEVAPQASTNYYPGRWGDWKTREPDQAGFDSKRLLKAVQFAKDHFNEDGGYNASSEPHGETIGPTRAPSGMNGLIIRNGYIVAEWGDTDAVDMTFSITKTYLSTVAGLAVDRGLIRNVGDPVRRYSFDGSFDAPHNRAITWHQLLNQTSGWEGTLWGKPDWADRFRKERRPAEQPGEHWRYNDVRVNQLALSLLHVWRKPLPQVLRELVMDPIGASPTWRWHGYENSWVNIDGLQMQSVSGGGHWGGGVFISSRDHARFGYLCLRDGRWKDQQILGSGWIKRATTPTPQQPTYGYMNWFLNTKEHKQFDQGSVGSVFFLGAGTNMIWIDPSHDLVTVVRWIDRRQVNEFVGLVTQAITDK